MAICISFARRSSNFDLKSMRCGVSRCVSSASLEVQFS